MIRIIAIALFTIIATTGSAYAQLAARAVAFVGAIPPNLEAELEITRDGVPVVDLTPAQVLVLESNVAIRPLSVERNETNGNWRVRWQTRYKSTGQFVITYQGQSATAFSTYSAGAPLMDFYSVVGPQQVAVQDYFTLGEIPAGVDTAFRVRARFRSENTLDTMIVDSVTVTGTAFSLRWRRAWPNYDTLPAKIYPGLPGDVDMRYNSNGQYVREAVTFYFRGGIQRTIFISANTFPLSIRPSITIVSPTTDTDFVPCQQVPIRWTGASPDALSTAEYSVDAGRTWRLIEQTDRDSVVWTVPDIITDKLLIRVRQDLTGSEQILLRSSQRPAPAEKVAFSTDGRRIASAHTDGGVGFWDLDGVLERNFVIGAPGEFSGPNALGVEGMTAVSPSRWVILWRNPINGRQHPITTVDLSGSTVARINLDSLKIPSHVAPLRGGAVVAVAFRNSSDVDILDAATLSVDRTLRYDEPVIALSANAETNAFYVVLLGGEVIRYNSETLAEVSRIQIREFPIPSAVDISADGLFLGVISRIGIGGTTEGLISLADGEVLRLREGRLSPPVAAAFSSTGKYLSLGYNGIPQLSLWNLPVNDNGGQVQGHSGELTDVDFSPSGEYLLSCAKTTVDNIRLRKFAFPEVGMIDEEMSIVLPQMSTQPLVAETTILGDRSGGRRTVTVNLRNEASLFLQSVRMRRGEHFSIEAQGFPRTLAPSQELILDFAFAPLDTGMIRDTIIIETCGREFAVPVEGFAPNRNLALLADGYNFGELCAGEKRSAVLVTLRNDDPTPIVFNRLGVSGGANAPFAISPETLPSELAPGDSLTFTITFQPRVPGPIQGTFEIYHSGQSNVIPRFTVSGTGLGVDLDPSLASIAFIPEQATRTVELSNPGVQDAVVEAIDFDPPGSYQVVSPQLPATIPVGGSLAVEIVAVGAPAAAQLVARVSPCLSEERIPIASYSGSLVIELPTVKADPRGRASLPLKLQLDEAVEWGQERDIEFDLSMNPRLFLPDSASASWGEASVVAMRIDTQTDRRITTVRVRGVFPRGESSVAIHGVVGLGEVLQTPIEIDTRRPIFSSALNVQVRSGMLELDVQDPTRRLVQPAAVAITSLAPNPASALLRAHVHSVEARTAILSVVDVTGVVVLKQSMSLAAGDNEVSLSVGSLTPGMWRLVINDGMTQCSTPFAVVR